MIRNYLKTALRNLVRYKGFAMINIASLAIGIIGCLVIGLFVWDEWQFDKDVPGRENIYRIYDQRNDNNTVTYMAPVPPVFASFLKQRFPEVDVTARILMAPDKYLWEANNKINYEDKGWFADSLFFKILPIKFIKGRQASALSLPSSIVISEDLAKKYFGDQDPIGKTIRVNKADVNVTGVFAKLPKHFHLDFHYIRTIPFEFIPKDRMDSWTWNQFYTDVKLKPGANVQLLQDKFQAYVRKEIYPTLPQAGSTFLPFFQPLRNIHLQSSNFVYDNAIRGNETYVRSLTIIAFFVLVIACFNFINLATARSFRRAKEIGVRKVVGAGRKQLIFQFIGETVLLSLLSMIIATIATLFIIPFLNQFTGKSIEFNPFTNPVLTIVILLLGVVIGIFAGIYPALVLSGFRPVIVLKSMKLKTKGFSGTWLRQSIGCCAVYSFGIVNRFHNDCL